MNYITISEGAGVAIVNTPPKKKFKCPYCDQRFERQKLHIHIQNNHEDLIPDGYTAMRVAFNAINNKTEGHCIICKKVTDWNEDKARYERLCNNPACHEAYKKMAAERTRKVYGTDRLQTDPRYAEIVQKRALAGRKMAGKYKFTDGGEVQYLGTYERKLLEFMDKVMNCKSEDIIAPGPSIKYTFEGKEHLYIPDFYYEPYELIIEIKDGGDNPNTHPKRIEEEKKNKAKEEAVKADHTFNYVRVVNNDFGQLLSIMAAIKFQMFYHRYYYPDPIVRSNESAVNESYLINEKDIYYNKDKFDSGEINLCFITGHSGSGKSTMAHGSENEKIQVNEMDDLFLVKDRFSIDDLKRRGDIIYAFFNGIGKKYYTSTDELDKMEEVKGHKACQKIYVDDLYRDFVNFAKQYAKSHKDRKYIVEGVALIVSNISGAPLFSPSEFKDYAFYIKGTSMLVSKFRQTKRDQNGIKDVAKNVFSRWISERILNEKAINQFRNYFQNLMKVNESGILEATEVNIKKKIYHLSFRDIDGKILAPSVPDNFLTRHGYEDFTTKRVCFSSSINKCLIAMSQNLDNKEFFVNIPDGNYKVYKPSVAEVPDANITGELWIQEPVKMKCIGKIKVTGDDGKDGMKYRYGDNKEAELYGWNWEWIDKVVNESGILESSDASSLDKNHKQKSGMKYNIIDTSTEEGKKLYNSNYHDLDKQKNCTFAMAVNNNKILGIINVRYKSNNQNDIGGFRVNDKYKGYGIGEKLFEYAIDKLNGNYLGVWQDNKVAIHLYEKYGFKKVKEKKYADGDIVIFMSNKSSLNESSDASSLDKNHKQLGNKKLNSFTQKVSIKKQSYGDSYVIRWYDDSTKVAEVLIDKDPASDGYRYFGSLRVNKAYRGYGIGEQIVQLCIDKYKAGALAVSKDNKVAYNLYKKLGFEVGKANGRDSSYYYMYYKKNQDKVINESNISINELKPIPKSVKLYHGSPIQGLKIITPSNDAMSKLGRIKAVYATKDKRFAACFGVKWRDDIAKQGTWDDWKTVIMGISDKLDTSKPCSLYELENDGNFLEYRDKESVSKTTVKVKKEYKYNTYLDMLKDNGVKIISYDDYISNIGNKNPEFKYLNEDMSGVIGAALAPSPIPYEADKNNYYIIQHPENNVFAYGITKDPVQNTIYGVDPLSKGFYKAYKTDKTKINKKYLTFKIKDSQSAKELYDELALLSKQPKSTFHDNRYNDSSYIYGRLTEGSKVITPDQLLFDSRFELVRNPGDETRHICQEIYDYILGSSKSDIDLLEEQVNNLKEDYTFADYNVLPDSINSRMTLSDLENWKSKFDAMPYEMRIASNDLSTSLYREDNISRYNRLLADLSSNKNPDYPIDNQNSSDSNDEVKIVSTIESLADLNAVDEAVDAVSSDLPIEFYNNWDYKMQQVKNAESEGLIIMVLLDDDMRKFTEESIAALKKKWDCLQSLTVDKRILSGQTASSIFGIDNDGLYYRILNIYTSRLQGEMQLGVGKDDIAYTDNADPSFLVANSAPVPYFTPGETIDNVSSNVEVKSEAYDLAKYDSQVLTELSLKLSYTSDESKRELIKNEIYALGWNPEIPYTEDVAKLANLRYEVFSSIQELDAEKVLTESAEIIEKNKAKGLTSEYLKNKIVPVFVSICQGVTLFSKGIMAFTKSNYSHAAIAFDSSLSSMYTFGVDTDNGKSGFTVDSLSKYKKQNYHMQLKVFALFVTPEQKATLKEAVKWYIDNKDNTRYSFKNIFNILLNKPSNNINKSKMICSQFVYSILSLVKFRMKYNKNSALVTPADLDKLSRDPRFYVVFEGTANKYNKEKVDETCYKLLPSLPMNQYGIGIEEGKAVKESSSIEYRKSDDEEDVKWQDVDRVFEMARIILDE